jgi:hypothetical protein
MRVGAVGRAANERRKALGARIGLHRGDLLGQLVFGAGHGGRRGVGRCGRRLEALVLATAHGRSACARTRVGLCGTRLVVIGHYQTRGGQGRRSRLGLAKKALRAAIERDPVLSEELGG